MQQIYTNYSMKNIPIPGKHQYQKKLIQKGEEFITRLRWKMFALQNPDTSTSKETFGFKTSNTAPQFFEIKPFETDFFEMIKNIQYRHVYNNFQIELKKDIKLINESNQVIINADKTQNKYKMDVDQYKNLLNQNITSTYKKCKQEEVAITNKKASEIAKKLKIENRIDQFIEADAYIKIKDHKPNFPARTQCRLINPSKSNIGKISKQITVKIVSKIKNIRRSNLWKNSQEVIDWFKGLQNKNNMTFLNIHEITL